MLRLDDKELPCASLIDLVVLPSMPVAAIVQKMTVDARSIIVLDTQGNMHAQHGADASGGATPSDGIGNSLSSFSSQEREGALCGGSAENCCLQNSDSKDSEYYFISGFNKLIEKLDDVKKLRDFVLVIDSITFVCDCAPQCIQHVINMLWALIYECGATVITVNHYRMGRVKRADGLVPRMGYRWEFFVAYQILFTYKKGEIVFTVKENEMKRL